MRSRQNKSLGSYGHFDMCIEKIHLPAPEIEGGENSPVPPFFGFFLIFGVYQPIRSNKNNLNIF